MPVILDYRQLPFDINKVTESGKFIGKSTYWRLFAIENMFRVVIHSVLSAQININWWSYVISQDKNTQVQNMKINYRNYPGGITLPGSHDIYYLLLSDLTKIITNQRNLFIQVIPNVDQWIIKLERIRLPRNLISHMNWLNVIERNRIDTTYKEARALLRNFSNSNIAILIP
ncbi:MAG TPA: hypothetical protein DIW23_10425 [Anaerolineae bacterium]|nr:hypothetical protein [Anaerolineae bacterium]